MRRVRAKMIRRLCTLTAGTDERATYIYRDLKRKYNRVPKKLRHGVAKAFLKEIEELENRRN